MINRRKNREIIWSFDQSEAEKYFFEDVGSKAGFYVTQLLKCYQR